MDDATYYAWWDRISAAQTVEALDAVMGELLASGVEEDDGDLEDLAHMAGQTRFVLIELARRAST